MEGLHPGERAVLPEVVGSGQRQQVVEQRQTKMKSQVVDVVGSHLGSLPTAHCQLPTRDEPRWRPGDARTFRRVLTAAAIVGCTLAMRADTRGDAELQFQLANLLFEETRYHEALQAFDRAIAARGRRGARRSRAQGQGRAALRIAEFDLATAAKRSACSERETPDAEALTLLRRRALVHRPLRRSRRRVPGRPRPRAGVVARPLRHRALAGHAQPARRGADEALAAAATAPRDGEIQPPSATSTSG